MKTLSIKPLLAVTTCFLCSNAFASMKFTHFSGEDLNAVAVTGSSITQVVEGVAESTADSGADGGLCRARAGGGPGAPGGVALRRGRPASRRFRPAATGHQRFGLGRRAGPQPRRQPHRLCDHGSRIA